MRYAERVSESRSDAARGPVVEIRDVTTDGRGVGRLDDGRVAFVDGALPGDTVRIEITRERTSRVDAVAVGTIVASPDRVDPPCPHQAACGGCPLMPLAPAAALALKVRHLEQTLRRVGRLAIETDEVIAAPRTERYRTRLRFAVAPRARGVAVGFHAASDPARLVPVDDCLLGPGEMTRIARRAVELIAARTAEEDDAAWPTHVTVRGTRDGAAFLLVLEGIDAPWTAGRTIGDALCEEIPALRGVHVIGRARRGRSPAPRHLAGARRLHDTIGPFAVAVEPGGFLQVNPDVAERLYACVARELAAGGAPRSVLDLYCGQGLAGLAASAPDTALLGVESDATAVRAARRLARTLGLTRARYRVGDAARVVRALAGTTARWEAVVVNPPRRGADPAIPRLAARLGARRIAIVSCHPATLARDARRFVEAGFAPRRLVAADMFPHTTHLEALLVMEAR